MVGVDNVKSGLATHYVAHDKLEVLKREIIGTYKNIAKFK